MKTNIFNLLKKIDIIIAILICLLFGFISLYRFVVPILIITIVAVLLFRILIVRTIKLNHLLAILLFSFYFIHVVGLLYSKDSSIALFDMQVKLSFIISPFIFLNFSISDKIRNKIYITYIIGLIISIIVCLLIVFINSLKFDQLIPTFELKQKYFYTYKVLSFFHHPTYMSMFCAMGMVILFYLYRIKYFSFKNNTIIIFIFELLIFTFIILLSSKAGILMGIILFLFFISFFIIKIELKLPFKILIILFASLLPILMLYNNIRVKVFVYQFYNNLQHKPNDQNNDRTVLWQAGIRTITKNFIFGVGAGDIKSELYKETDKQGNLNARIENLNVHNQYLETLIGQGIFGLIWLLLLLLWPLMLSIKRKNIIGIGFITIIGINFMFESMLNTQAGVVFFAFFYCFIFIAEPKNDTAQSLPQNPI